MIGQNPTVVKSCLWKQSEMATSRGSRRKERTSLTDAKTIDCAKVRLPLRVHIAAGHGDRRVPSQVFDRADPIAALRKSCGKSVPSGVLEDAFESKLFANPLQTLRHFGARHRPRTRKTPL